MIFEVGLSESQTCQNNLAPTTLACLTSEVLGINYGKSEHRVEMELLGEFTLLQQEKVLSFYMFL